MSGLLKNSQQRFLIFFGNCDLSSRAKESVPVFMTEHIDKKIKLEDHMSQGKEENEDCYIFLSRLIVYAITVRRVNFPERTKSAGSLDYKTS